jgi:putative endonuclease
VSKDNLYFGKAGEDKAAAFLAANGYKILKRNYKTRLGEIDIIARDRETICFVEVKSRTTERFGLPQEAISKLKQRQIAKVALMFLKENDLLDSFTRFDAVCLLCSQDKPKLELIKNAFDLTR